MAFVFGNFDMHIQVVNGRNLVCGHIFPASELEVGQFWVPAVGSNRVHEIIANDGETITHRWIETGEIFHKSAFGFQCRYCKVVE